MGHLDGRDKNGSRKQKRLKPMLQAGGPSVLAWGMGNRYRDKSTGSAGLVRLLQYL